MAIEYDMVIDVGSEGTYDVDGVVNPLVVKVGTGYKMMYLGSASGALSVIYCDSADRLTWANFQKVAGLGAVNFFSLDSLLYVDGAYRLYYTDYDVLNDAQVSSCTSSDMLTWAALQAVVVKNSEGTYDTDGAFFGTVVKDESVYKMRYVGFVTLGGGVASDIYCDSADGVAWTNYLKTNMAPLTVGNDLLFGTIVKVDSIFHAWISEADVAGDMSIVYFTSLDMKTWSGAQLAIAIGSEGTYDAESSSAPTCFYDDGFKIYYTGKDISGTNRIIYTGSKNANWKIPINMLFKNSLGVEWKDTIGVDWFSENFFKNYSEKFSSEPMALVGIELDGGAVYYAKIDTVSDNFYEGYIKKFGGLSRSISHENASFETSSITLTFANVDRHFTDYDFKTIINRTVSLSLGFVGMLESDFKTLFTGIIADFSYTPESFSMSVKDATLKYLDTKDFAKVIDSTNWPNAKEGVVGKVMPIGYGDISTGNGALKALLVATVASGHKYIVFGHASVGVQAVWKKDADNVKTLLTITTDYTTDNKEVFDGDYITTITTVADLSAFDIICDAEGVENVGDGTGTLIINPIDQTKDFILNWLDLPINLLNVPAFADATGFATVNAYSSAGAIAEKRNGKDVISDMCFATNASIYHDTNGQISVDIFDTNSYTDPNTLELVDDQNDIFAKSFKLSPKIKNLANKIIVNYSYDYGLGEYIGQDEYIDQASIDDCGREYVKELSLKFCYSTSQAAYVAQEYLAQHKYPYPEMTFKSSLQMLNSEISDIIRVTHFAGLDAGGYNEHVFQILRLDPNLDGNTVTVTAFDMSDRVRNVFILGDETVLPAAWTSATDTQKRYGYLADETTGEFSDGDPGKVL